MKISCAQYPIGTFASLEDWRANAARWVDEAAGAGAQLLLFPEYGGMELASLLPEAVQRDLTGQIAAMQQYRDAFVETYAALARQHGVFVVGPSLPVKQGDGFVNRAYVFSPAGAMGFQDKRQMTRFEREDWIIGGGADLKMFEARIGGETIRFGIDICYDIEFPLIAHAQAAAGADLVLAPSCTDTLAGANRVLVGARARALENQVYVAVAPTVGNAAWSPAVDVNLGWAGVFAAPDRGLPDDGVIVQGKLNAPGWVYADLDFGLLRRARDNAQVFTRRDWDGQMRPSLAVAVETL
ncbi:carbon-nitrogen hydrolase family protein [Ferrovibrio sp.]|uniref:carbon-nitrogen hydrolase family protein n=1 Tax=Ferrovibrio sp. TaxID=1917215 RepID=UPI00261410D0|nr:carbon-nitrogen hydrolase family protein [Ferrovibrio sp.]